MDFLNEILNNWDVILPFVTFVVGLFSKQPKQWGK
jgi:hypothetical protein